MEPSKKNKTDKDNTSNLTVINYILTSVVILLLSGLFTVSVMSLYATNDFVNSNAKDHTEIKVKNVQQDDDIKDNADGVEKNTKEIEKTNKNVEKNTEKLNKIGGLY